ncbi:MAG: hypothetical protein COU81_00105 [Candidatus Portnoybacteria bacterium CG10_big_fil_rev_8_21_14_0_10_36_7]|uniref:thymidine kinase n=1 Tax=Candidatus Portnoybacteria bacterium CG10_big_fil_rev_8_21_14_0_10_36_7 TaxID=1974812 RepID=A0A2M8KF54_9BACT|nr:MAG: hypothetical protein COU81_00105 [Candidatus Portnoybacteria bacterium CG10_big_fil_rev_8_21_14_0_10_36_7]
MRFLTLIFGTVGSGKTAEMFKIINKLQEHNLRCQPAQFKKFVVFKPITETRSDQTTIISRTGQTFNQVIAVNNTQNLKLEIAKYPNHIIIIEECQLFEINSDDIQAFVALIKELLKQNRQIILGGLIQNSHGQKFDILSSLCSEADEIINPHTTCNCGQIASRSQRLQMGYPTPITDPIFLVDNSFSHDLGYSYEPRCNDCFELPLEPHPNLKTFRSILAEIKDLKDQQNRP